MSGSEPKPASDTGTPCEALPLRVLVVDDEPVIAAEIAEFLSWEGISCVAVHSAEAALLYLRASQAGSFTVTVTDVRMPGMDGLALARLIRNTTAEAVAVEVIALTGHGSHDLMLEALRIPVFECMFKPLSLTRLLATILQAHATATARRRRFREDADGLAVLRARARAVGAAMGSAISRVRGSSHFATHMHPAHESNDPATTLMGVLGFVAAGDTQDEADSVKAQVAAFGRRGDRLRRVVEAVVTLAEIEAGRWQGARDDSTLLGTDLLERAAAEHAGLAQEHGKSIEVRRPPTRIAARDHPCLGVAVEQLVVCAIRSSLVASVIRLEAEFTSSDIMVHVNEWPSGSVRPAFTRVMPIDRPHPAHAPRGGADPDCPDLAWAELAVAEAAAGAIGGRLEVRPALGLSASVVVPWAAALVI